MSSRLVSLGQLKADVADQADVAGLTTRHTASLLTRRINQSIQRFRERISTEGCQHYLTNTTGLFTAGATSPYPFYALDLSAASPAIVRTYAVDITVGSQQKTLIHVPFQERTKYSGPTITGEPIAWANYQTAGVAIMPAPNAAYAYCVWHLPVLPDLSADSDTFDGVAGWEEAIVWDAVCAVAARDQNQQGYTLATNTRDAVWADAIRGATRVALAGGRVIGRDSFGEKLHSLGAARRLPRLGWP